MNCWCSYVLPAVRNHRWWIKLHLSAGQCTGSSCTSVLLRRESPEFTGPDMRPPNSLDLDPVDYHIRGMMQERFSAIPRNRRKSRNPAFSQNSRSSAKSRGIQFSSIVYILFMLQTAPFSASDRSRIVSYAVIFADFAENRQPWRRVKLKLIFFCINVMTDCRMLI